MDDLLNDIIKYKRGELSSKEMHALERRALNDPFLAEALEGVENISAEDLSSDVAEINQKILKKKRPVWFSPLRIAAGIILVATSIFVFYQVTPKNESLALKTDNKKSLKTQAKVSDSSENSNALSQFKQNEIGNEQKKDVGKAGPEKKRIADQQLALSAEPKNKNQPADAKTLAEADSKIDGEELKENVQLIVATQPIVVKPVEIQSQELKEETKPSAKMNKAVYKSEQMSGAGLVSRAHANVKFITGKVVSAEDGSVLPGVNVIVEGTTQGTVTDAKGAFNIQTSDDEQRLVFSFIGMQTKEVDIKGKDKLDVELGSDVSQLSEVVVTALGFANDDRAEPEIRLAYPEGGVKAYDNYLETNVRYPEEALKNNVKGKVKVEFIIHEDGSIDQFKVIKRIGYGCEDELIRLIKGGAKWFPTTENGKPVESRVRVGLKFDPAKNGR